MKEFIIAIQAMGLFLFMSIIVGSVFYGTFAFRYTSFRFWMWTENARITCSILFIFCLIICAILTVAAMEKK
jgi:thiamine transporter ThiT